MLKRYRNLLIAIGIVASLAVATCLSLYVNDQAYARQNAAKAGRDYANYYADCARAFHPGFDIVDCMVEQAKAEHEEKHAEANLKTQQDVALWSLILMILGVVGAFLSAAGVALLIWTFREQRKLTITQSRAWVGLLGFKSTPIGTEEMPNGYLIKFEWKNTGSSPATKTDCRVARGMGLFVAGETPEIALPDSLATAAAFGVGMAIFAGVIEVSKAEVAILVMDGRKNVMVRLRASYADIYTGEIRTTEHWRALSMEHGRFSRDARGNEFFSGKFILAAVRGGTDTMT